MHNEMHEPGPGMLKSTTSNERLGGRQGDVAARPAALNAPAVDEALADDTMLADATPMGAQRGSRRELTGMTTEADRRIIDDPHAGSAWQAETTGDGVLLRQLSQQLSSLQAQQHQIRRLLEQAEQRATAKRGIRG